MKPDWLAHAQRFPGFHALYADGDDLLGARGYRLCRLTADGSERTLGVLPAAAWQRIVSHVRFLRHGLRLGVLNARLLADGQALALAKRTIYKLDPVSGDCRLVCRIRHGNKPGFNGVLVTPSGTVFYAEYSLNHERRLPSGVFRSDDHGETFRMVHEFAPGEVRHVHFIQWDPYEACLWLGTGDRDAESRILTSRDGGATWQVVGGGSQEWRAIGVAFAPDSVYWGTDAGLDAGTTPNALMRWDRHAGTVTALQALQGPTHGIARLSDGTILLATGVEGGRNETDRRVHLWALKEGTCREWASWRKDPWPAVVQIGAVHFPHAVECATRPVLVLLGLLGQAETTWLAAGMPNGSAGEVSGQDAV